MRYVHIIVCGVAVLSGGLQAGAAGGSSIRGVALVAGKPAANVVVWLEAPHVRPRPSARSEVLDQRNLQFAPRVLVVPTGTAVRFPNNDRVFHNVFSFHHGKVFDLGLYPVGESKIVRFDRPGVSRIFCNIHPNMAAYVLSVDSTYFAVSDPSGGFAITGVPPGDYTYRAWRAGGSDLSGRLSAVDGASLAVEWPR